MCPKNPRTSRADYFSGSGPLNLYRFNPPSIGGSPWCWKGEAPSSLQILTVRTMGKSDASRHPETSKNYGVRKLRCVATRTDLKRRRQLYVSWTVSTIERTGVSAVIWGEMLGNIGKTPLKIRPESPKKECIFQPPIVRCFIGFRKGIQMIDTCSKTKTSTTKSSALFSKAKGYLLQHSNSVLLDHKKEWVKCKLCDIIVDSSIWKFWRGLLLVKVSREL